MADPFVELYTFKLTSPSTQPPFVQALKSTHGLSGLYFGPVLELPGTYMLALHWSSQKDHHVHVSSAQFPVWHAQYKSAVKTPDQLAQTQMARGDVAHALGAPCTEVLTAYAVEEKFPESCAEFVDKVDRGLSLNDGYRGYAMGETVGEISKVDEDGTEGSKGKGVVVILGWDSKEAHLEAKAKPGPIGENINLIRSGRKDMTLYHVNFAKLS